MWMLPTSVKYYSIFTNAHQSANTHKKREEIWLILPTGIGMGGGLLYISDEYDVL